ncbi:MAG TPA: glucosidase [Candidatus Limnocylindria bacterium]|nr:glucosidase [Candidatus Limnocylindria bacterium]
MEQGAELRRMETVGHPEASLDEAGPWWTWGPYLSERAWGSVREDYSADGNAWDYFPHDHARSRSYRWNEDGLAGLSTMRQDLCFALAFWNGEDPILKERIFGLGGPEGNHGEDAKEYWWYLDATPSHSFLHWRYHYPQGEFPYDDLVRENASRDRGQPEFELLDTGAFDEDRYWTIDATYAKADPTDLYLQVRVTNEGPDAATLHVLPHLWFRDTWSWGVRTETPQIRVDGGPDGDIVAEHPRAGTYRLAAAPGPGGEQPTALFCDNVTNEQRIFGRDEGPDFPKDGINDHVVSGAATVNPDQTGTKSAWWYRLDVPAGETRELRLRLWSPTEGDPYLTDWSGSRFDEVLADRKAEADEFYADLVPGGTSAAEARVVRQALAGLIWSKQFYRYDLQLWLDGDPGSPPPPDGHRHGRNAGWRHFDAYDILSMPDPWEYPWFAAWDLAFQTVAVAHIAPAFAKYQLLLMCREWFMHPNGAIPAYEWSFDDVNPPVHAWAALEVFRINGAKDHEFLERVFQKLLLNFTWWVNRVDPEGNNVFEGGFLGLDNIGAVDRSHLPPGTRLDQTDGTAWMAFYALTMLRIALTLTEHDEVYEDLATKFFEHFVMITEGINASGLWDPSDGFFYDQLVAADGTRTPLRVKSLVGVIPVLAAIEVPAARTLPGTRLRKRFADFLARRGIDEANIDTCGFIQRMPDRDTVLLSTVDPERLRRVLTEVLDEDGMLSPYGIRSLSKRHKDEPFSVDVDGQTFTVGYEPAESQTSMYGGNSNWRGPVWFPVNHLVVEALERYYGYLGDSFVVECPTGSGREMNLGEVAAELRTRLVSLFLPGPDGLPSYGNIERFRTDPRWSEGISFFEYFDGDHGYGLGASHQTGWTALVADLILRRPRAGS